MTAKNQGKGKKGTTNPSKKKGASGNKPPTNKKPPLDIKANGGEPPKKKWWQKTWGVLLIIFAIGAGALTSIQLYDRFKSNHEKFEEKTSDSGTFKPPELPSPSSLEFETMKSPPIFNKARNDPYPKVKGILLKDKGSDIVYLIIGSGIRTVSKDILKKGIEFTTPQNAEECYQTNLSLVLKDNRIYVSTVFKDLKKGEVVGTIEYNHWKVYYDNLLDYKNDDERLEVKDKQGYVIFSINFNENSQSTNNGTLNLSGYFMNPNSILIVNSVKELTFGNKPPDNIKCISKNNPDWYKEAEQRISKIQSVY